MQWVIFVVNLAIQVHWIQSFPPFSFAISRSLKRVVWYTRHWTHFVTGVSHSHKLAPGTRRCIVKSYAKTQPMLTGFLFPNPYNVFFGTDIYRIPGLIL